MTSSERPRLGITVGDPAGIGPEIVARLVAQGRLASFARLEIYAHEELFSRALREAGAEVADVSIHAVEAGPVPRDFRVGTPSAFTGRAAAASVEAATRAALAGELDAVVTAPLAKSALARAGISHPGHTEFLAELAGVSEVRMMFVAPSIRLTLATIHVALREVSANLDVGGLVETIRLTRECLLERARVAAPRIAVLGLNPHASEGGMFGREEADVIEPAVERAREIGWAVEGPFAADSFFFRKAAGFDATVAMYHDQGLIPVKLLSEGRAVNVTLGLPFLRTSVDHGTAFDIAGKGIASAESLVEAVRLAARWSRGRAQSAP